MSVTEVHLKASRYDVIATVETRTPSCGRSQIVVAWSSSDPRPKDKEDQHTSSNFTVPTF